MDPQFYAITLALTLVTLTLLTLTLWCNAAVFGVKGHNIEGQRLDLQGQGQGHAIVSLRHLKVKDTSLEDSNTAMWMHVVSQN